METPPLSNPHPPPPPPPPPFSMPEEFKHKNRLQEFAQRSAIPLPSYHTVNEGFPHAPKFKSTVVVDGVSYNLPQTFTHRKEAEQGVAKFAFESIRKKIRDEGCAIIPQDTTFCKSILNEFAVKVNLAIPTYTTTQSEGLLPLFISTLVFDGRTYNGDPGRNKKEAEQLAARAVIQSILGTELGPVLFQIIKSKTKLYAALHKVKDNNAPQSEDIVPVRNVPDRDPPAPELKKPKLEPGLIENVPQVLDPSPCGVQLQKTGDQSASTSTIGKKRARKNKKKGLKRSLVEQRLEVGVQPKIQAPTCSVAQ